MTKRPIIQRLPLLYRTITLLVIAVVICQIMLYLWIQSSVKDHFRQMDSEILTHTAFNIRRQAIDSQSHSSEHQDRQILNSQPQDEHNTDLKYSHSNTLNYDLTILTYNLQGDLLRSEPSASNSELAIPLDIKSLYSKYQNNLFDLSLNGRHYRALIIQEGEQLSIILLPIDVHHQYLNQFNYHLKWLLTIMTLLLVSVAAASVYWGFAPLNTFVQKMRSINPKQLSERVNIEGMPIELRPLAQSYNTMMDTLERNFESLSRFSNNIAHELRTPIATLGTQTQVMLSQPRSTAEYVEQLHHQHDTLEQLSDLVNNMLLLAKTQRGIANEQMQRVKIDVMIDQLIDYYDFLAEERGLVLSKTGKYAQVNGDTGLLKRLFANLISNAVYYAKSGSKITVTGHVVDKYARLELNSPSLKSSVCDNVKHAEENIKDERSLKQYKQIICIENELAQPTTQVQVNQFFERFYRHRTSSDEDNNQFKHMGTGLGLSIVTSIVKAHNGEVSANVKGSVLQIKVELPVQN